MELIQHIIDAFSWRPLPEKVIADGAIASELTRDALAFQGKAYTDITSTDWKKYFDAVYGFTPDAFCYYLPNIMILKLRTPNEDFLITDSIIGMLDRSNIPNSWDTFFTERWLNFTQSEYTVIAEWLLWLTEHESCQTEINRAFDTINLLKQYRHFTQRGENEQ